jgi:hypothetical protein
MGAQAMSVASTIDFLEDGRRAVTESAAGCHVAAPAPAAERDQPAVR